MLVDTLLIYDHLFQTVKAVSHVFCPDNVSQSDLSFIYQTAVEKARRLAKLVLSPVTPEVIQPPIQLGNEAVSNVGKNGYEGLVTKLKEHIVAGDIIQAVPSHARCCGIPFQIHLVRIARLIDPLCRVHRCVCMAHECLADHFDAVAPEFEQLVSGARLLRK